MQFIFSSHDLPTRMLIQGFYFSIVICRWWLAAGLICLFSPRMSCGGWQGSLISTTSLSSPAWILGCHQMVISLVDNCTFSDRVYERWQTVRWKEKLITWKCLLLESRHRNYLMRLLKTSLASAVRFKEWIFSFAYNFGSGVSSFVQSTPFLPHQWSFLPCPSVCLHRFSTK